MKNFILIGCDLHDKSMMLKIAHNDGPSEKRSFATDAVSRAVMIAHLKKRAAQAGGAKVVVVYEASSAGYGLYDALTEAGIECHVLAPANLPSSAKSRRNKTDEKDAERLLDVLRSHVLAHTELPEVWVPDPQTRDDRALLRARVDTAEKAGSVKTEIRSVMKLNSLVAPSDIGDKWGQAFRGWLRTVELPFGARNALDSLMRQMEGLGNEGAALDASISELAGSDRYRAVVKELDKIPGVAVLTAMMFLTELGDPSRFKNRRQIAAYFGLVPTSHESGDHGDRKGHITHQGSKRVRRLTCQAQWSRVRHDPKEKAWHDRVVERNPKKKKIATVAGMRRLVVLMWHRALEVKLRAGCNPPLPSPPKGGSASLRNRHVYVLKRTPGVLPT